MDCVERQNKLETPKEKDEVNKREVCLLLIDKARTKDKTYI